jgi:dynein heavy chain 2
MLFNDDFGYAMPSVRLHTRLFSAMSMGLGGNPYGPAGTGKTESVKALGGLFGRQVLVFNCDEGIDVMSMGRIFTGLVKCGAWGCFDEFNRLDEAVLSAVSMQIQVIQDAIKKKSKMCRLLDKEVKLKGEGRERESQIWYSD